MTGLTFADTGFSQRVIGSMVKTQYTMPDGWKDTNTANPTWTGKTSKDSTTLVLLMQPDKSLDLKPSQCGRHTYLRDFKRTEELVDVLQKQSPEDLQELMGLGKKMAKAHRERFASFECFPAKQACLIFGGEAMQAVDWSDSDQKFAEAHLRIISGLYGLLRPFDDVKPVRDVPMGAQLQTKRGKTVREFWGDLITKQLAKDIGELAKRGAQKTLLVANLSDEYWAAVHSSGLPSGVEVVRVAFQGGSEDSVRRAYGLLARHVVRKRVTDTEGLRDFSDDWAFDRSVSRDSKLIFAWDGDDAGADKTAPKVKVKKAAADPGYHSSGSSGGEEPARQASRSRDGCRDSRSPSRSCSPPRRRGGVPRSTRNRRRAGTTRCSSSRSRSPERPARRGRRRDSRSRSRGYEPVKRSRR